MTLSSEPRAHHDTKTKTQEDTSALNVPARTTSLSAAIFNLTKSAVGAGTVYLPAIFYALGPTLASTLLLSGAVFCSISLYFLGRMAHHCETGDYFKLGRLALGKHGETAVSVSLLLFLLGGLIAYANLTGIYISSAIGTMRQVADAEQTFLSSGNVTLMAAAFLIFPLSLLRDMSMLAKTSIVGMVSMLYISGLLAYDALTHGNATFGIGSAVEAGQDQLSLTGMEFAFKLCGYIGKLIFAFVNHFTIVSLVPVMKNPSAGSRKILVATSTLAAIGIYFMAALGGYYRFGSLCAGVDALSAFPTGSQVPFLFTIAKLLLGFVLVCSFPLLCDPARSCLDSLCFGSSSTVPATIRHYLETGLIVTVPTAIAFFLKDQADDFLSLFAGFCGSLLVFSFPGIFFLILSRRFKYSISPVERSLAYFCVALGIFLAVISTVANLKVLYISFISKATA